VGIKKDTRECDRGPVFRGSVSFLSSQQILNSIKAVSASPYFPILGSHNALTMSFDIIMKFS